MAENKENDTAWNLANSIRESNEALAKSIVAAQERNMKFAQSIFMNGMEVLKNQAESTRTLMQELEQQALKQQEALQKLAKESADTYTDVFRTPLSYYQQALDTAEATTRQGLEIFQQALNTAEATTRQGIENFQKATQQGIENAQDLAQQAQNAAKRAAK
ncbi:MAG: hypothetical protein NVS4B7_12230 [Ktedonobacteraceae bacterium]